MQKKAAEKPKDHCDICREIRVGCEADALNPERCAVCNRKSCIVDPRTGLGVPCSSCKRGFRLKLWLKHQQIYLGQSWSGYDRWAA